MPKPNDTEPLLYGRGFFYFLRKAAAQNRLQSVKNREARCRVSLFL